jgi:FkbM family methyltransferase
MRRMVEIGLGSLVVRRRLPIDAGAATIFASGKVGGLKFILKNSRNWDPEFVCIAVILVKSGQTVWDVGANVGLFSKAAAFHAGERGRVISIEADIDAVTLLNRTCQLHSPKHAKMTVLPVAVSDTVGFVRFSIAKRARAANSIQGYGSTQTGGVSETRTLPCVTLDSLLEHFPAPDMLKIDVEGAEFLVLQGGNRLLSNVRPVIYCEVAEKARSEVTRLLEHHGYGLWDGSRFDGTTRTKISIAAHNTVAIPEEKVAEYERLNV